MPTWRDLSGQFAPRRGRFLESAPDAAAGRRRDEKLIDNTSLIAARVMASGMMAGISSPARPWFRLRLVSERANEDPGARAWLDEVQQRMLRVFAKSNLYNCLHTLYGELGVFGTGALWIDEDEDDIVRGYTLTVGEYWLASSNRLAIDTLYRSMWWTVRQIVDTFGRETVSAGLAAAYDSGQLDLEYELVHAIEPNPNAAGPDIRGPHNPWNGHLSNRLPWRSVWFERSAQGENLLLRASGYTEFPCMVPRWDVVGTDSWGSGPGWVALGDALQLQVQQHRKLEAIDKQIRPPMVGPPSLKNEPASLLPGGVTYVADPNGQSFRPAIDVRLDLGALAADIQEVQGRIKEAFYANLFLMLAESDRREITAREIDERREEKMLMLGPVLERLHDELLQPLVTRVFNIMARNGLIGGNEPPEPLEPLDPAPLVAPLIKKSEPTDPGGPKDLPSPTLSDEEREAIIEEAPTIAEHAYEEHVEIRREFPHINSYWDFVRHIQNVMETATEKFRADGRTYYWHGPSKTMVIRDPYEPHGGSAFKTEKSYFDNLKARYARSSR